MASRAYKTLPSAFKRDRDSSNGSAVKKTPSRPSSRSANVTSPTSEGIFHGLELKLGLANLISNGMNLFGQLRNRKTPNHHSASSNTSSPTSVSSTSAAYFECHSEQEQSSATSANVSEIIEMTSFKTVAEGDLEQQSGRGHIFQGISSYNPIWCDQCRDLIWGLYDTGAMRCANCNLTCHDKCKSKVQLNCTAFERPDSSSSSSSGSSGSEKDQSTLAGISTIIDEEELLSSQDEDEGTLKNIDLLALDGSTIDEVTSLVDDSEATLVQSIMDTSLIAPDDMTSALMLYNDGFPTGQETMVENGTCKGFIRVVLNLSRPINVLPGTKPPSVLNLTQESLKSQADRTLTSFYLPPETEKTLCVTNATTTRDVIRSLLSKFRIVDNPHKYVLYEKRPLGGTFRRCSTDTVSVSGSNRSRATLGRINLRKLENSDKPLMIALNNCLKYDCPNSTFVLQENDPGEIDWDSFSMPELKNFLLILDREEAWYKRKIHEKYELIHEHMNSLAEEKKPSE